MKASVIISGLLAAAASAFAQAPAVIYQPAPQATVISPLTNATAQSNQALLNQINATLSQRRFEHQVLTLPAAPITNTQPALFIAPRVIPAR